MQLIRHPPTIAHELTWRQLYRDGTFAQRELLHSGMFQIRARERGAELGIGNDSLKYLHEVGALRPVAFSRVGYSSGFIVPAEAADALTFADEAPGPWGDYAREQDEHPTVTALYSPWQQLCAADATRGATFTVPLWLFLADAEARDLAHEQLRGAARAQNEAWRALDDSWRPLLQILVRLQNRYWPELTLRSTLLWDPETRERYDPYPVAYERFDAKTVLDRDLGGDRAGVLDAYHFLVERGMSLDPRDGLTLLRRAVPRAFHVRWEREPRLAQDHFDAADLLRRFLVDVDGCQPPQPGAMLMDGRQPERKTVYERGPAAPWDGREVVQTLQAAELYPHGVHVIHEGSYDRAVIEQLVVALIGSTALEEVNFTDLGGAGSQVNGGAR